MKYKLSTLALLILVILSSCKRKSWYVEGTVVDSTGVNPVQGIKVQVRESHNGNSAFYINWGTSDVDGHFKISYHHRWPGYAYTVYAGDNIRGEKDLIKKHETGMVLKAN